jgi:hypothetical protein
MREPAGSYAAAFTCDDDTDDDDDRLWKLEGG